MAARPTPGAARRTVLAVLACVLSLPAPAAGAPTVTLKAGLRPERLGSGTTLKFALSVTFAHGEAPVPLRVLEVRLPAHLGVATSGLGLTTCRPAMLEVDGPPGCPSTSVMGYGSGLAEVPFGPEPIFEPVRLTAFMAPLHDGHLGLLFFAEGEEPVNAELVFHGVVQQAAAPFGGDLQISIPLVPAWPEGPGVSLLKFATTIGPEHITYWEYSRRRFIPYHPRGIQLPPRCPRGGFQFAAALAFENGARTSARAVVPCPGGHLGAGSQSPRR
jgi:hypothetical protein